MLKESLVVLLIHLEDEAGTPLYAYIAMPSEKASSFAQDYESSPDWPDYVRLLYQGEGEYPPEEIRAYVYDTFSLES